MDTKTLFEAGSYFGRYVSTDPVLLVRSFFMVAAGAVTIINSLPALQQRFVRYGARSIAITDEHGKQIEQRMPDGPFASILDAFASLQVPHSWFKHFYVVSVLSSLFWGVQLVQHGFAFRSLANQNMASASKEPSMMPSQVLLAWTMMSIQGIRRMLECILLNKPSKSKMALPAYLLGITFYMAIGVAIWVEGIPTLLQPNALSMKNILVDLVSVKSIIGVPLFISGSVAQNYCHVYLASLKKYSLPQSKMFSSIISPHYTSECVIYLGIAVVAAPVGQIMNKSIAVALFFEVINLGITAESTREWYCQKFGPQSVQDRWRMFPYVY